LINKGIRILIDMEPTHMNDLATRLAEARKELHMSQTELGKRVGCSQGLIANLESRIQRASMYVPQIAEVLGVSALWLAKGKGPKHLDQTKGVTDIIGRLSDREVVLIQGFRAMGEEAQDMLLYQAQRVLDVQREAPAGPRKQA
jgi:transcriptional regulator with XRE-family HTH domain